LALLPALLLVLLCAGPVPGQEDPGPKPDDTGTGIAAETDLPGPDGRLLTPADEQEILANLRKAEHARLNKTFTLDIGTGLNWNMMSFYEGRLDNIPGKKFRTPVDGLSTGWSIGFSSKLKGADMSVKLSFTAGLLNLDKFDGTFTPGAISAGITSAVGVVPYQFGLGGPFYSGSGPEGLTPLSSGNLNLERESSRFLFERFSWDEVNEPLRYYNNIYKNSGAAIDSRAGGSGKAGMFLTLSPPGWQAAFFLAKSGTWSPVVRIVKLLKPFNLSLNYQNFNLDPDMSFRPLKYAHIGTVGLQRSTANLNLKLEGGYSYGGVTSAFLATNRILTGQAGLFSLQVKHGRLFLFDAFSFQLSAYYASKNYFGQAANAVKNSYSFANTNHYQFVGPVKTVGDLLGDAASLFPSVQFKFMTGTVKLTWGAVSTFSRTIDAFKLPHDLGHKVWASIAADMAGNYPAPQSVALWQDWDWGTDAGTENYLIMNYNGSNALVSASQGGTPYTVPSGTILRSRKHYALARIEYQYELSQLVGLPFPLYYYGRFIFSGVFVRRPVNLPFASRGRVYEYGYMDHFLAAGLRPDFFLIGYVGTERNALGGDGLLRTPFIMTGTGYGIGVDWFFKGGMGLYVKVQGLEHRNQTDANLGFKCWWANVELTKYFEY
jgi:hypothetical protein